MAMKDVINTQIWGDDPLSNSLEGTCPSGLAAEKPCPARCVILLKGHLNPSCSEWLDGLQISHRADGTTLLSGPVQDQAALYGLLGGLRDLNAGPGLDLSPFAEHRTTLWGRGTMSNLLKVSG
jgi:hypothetical protein